MKRGLLILFCILCVTSVQASVSKYHPRESWILDPINFEIHSAELGPRQMEQLLKVAKALKFMLNEPRVAGLKLTAHGHANAGERNAMKLSRKRAKAVKRKLNQLVKGRLIINIEAYGATKPYYDPTTDDGIEKNGSVRFTASGVFYEKRINYPATVSRVLKKVGKNKKISDKEIIRAIPKNSEEASQYYAFDYNSTTSNQFRAFQRLVRTKVDAGNVEILREYLLMSDTVDGYFAEMYFDHIEGVAKKQKTLLCQIFDEFRITQLKRLINTRIEVCR